MKFLLIAALLATPVMAADGVRELCTDRPGLNTAPCTVDAGHLQIEAGLGDWLLDKQADSRTDTITLGQTLARYGVGPRTELRLNWTAYGHIRERDRSTGAVDRRSGTGDVTLGIKQNLASPDGTGFSIALLPQATVPAGSNGIGAGDWSVGLLIPVNYDIGKAVTLEVTPEIDAATDEDRDGRHLAYGTAAGASFHLNDKLDLSAEALALRDRDPGNHATQLLAALSLAYQPQDQLQLDVGAQAGLNRHSPDVEVYFGISRKF